MQGIKKRVIGVVALCFLSQGCLAALPLLYLAPLLITGGMAGYSLTGAALSYAKNRKTQQPTLDFDRKWPDCITFDKGMDPVFKGCQKVLADLQEETDKVDPGAGVIEAKKTVFGEPQGSPQEPAKMVTFWQRKVITVKKTATAEQTEVLLQVIFTRQSANKPEETVADEAAANVVRGVFFSKLENVIKDLPSNPEARIDRQSRRLTLAALPAIR